MAKKVLGACLIACFILAGTSQVFAQATGLMEFSDKAVKEAIDKGIKALWDQCSPQGTWMAHGAPANQPMYYPDGPTALAAYALLENNVNPQDPRMKKTLEWLAKQNCDKTYSLGIRCNVWLSVSEKDDSYKKYLRKDAQKLWENTVNGSYWYPIFKDKADLRYDNSNSQYGLLGVWAASLANIEVPTKYWEIVMKHWIDHQNADGGWEYQGPGGQSTHTMTAAGVASLYVCLDNLLADAFIKCNVNNEFLNVKRGLDWFDRNFLKYVQGAPNGYFLYGIERVGLASGYKYFGTADWYKLGATQLINAQLPNGQWRGGWGDLPETCFALLFLARGRNAILFNKLEYQGDWNNRPRNLSSITYWISRTFETKVNWQIINLRVPVTEWHDAPMLFISGSKAPVFSDAEIDKIREFVYQGGTIVSCTECKGKDFEKGIREAYKRMFPEYELVPIAPDHELYGIYFKLSGKPKFSILTNGVRPLVIHTDEDISLDWQLKKSATKKNSFQVAANIARYVTDKITDLRPRGTSHWPEDKQYPTAGSVKIARLQFAGNYDPEKLAYRRFTLMMARDYGLDVQVTSPLDIAKDLAGAEAKIAVLTGTGKLILNAAEKEALKAFTDKGGLLFIDAAGGSLPFANSAENLIEEIYGKRSLKTLPLTSDIYTLKNADPKLVIRDVLYRSKTQARLGSGNKSPHLKVVLNDKDQPIVIFSPEDITAGLVGFPAHTIDGYERDSAFQLMRNIALLVSGKEIKPGPTSVPADNTGGTPDSKTEEPATQKTGDGTDNKGAPEENKDTKKTEPAGNK